LQKNLCFIQSQQEPPGSVPEKPSDIQNSIEDGATIKNEQNHDSAQPHRSDMYQASIPYSCITNLSFSSHECLARPVLDEARPQISSMVFDFSHGKARLCTFDFDALNYSEDLLVELCVEIFIEVCGSSLATGSQLYYASTGRDLSMLFLGQLLKQP
jgi:hypothetical protein